MEKDSDYVEATEDGEQSAAFLRKRQQTRASARIVTALSNWLFLVRGWELRHCYCV